MTIRDFIVCENCLMAVDSSQEGVECCLERTPAITPRRWKCSRGAWILTVNGKRDLISLNALLLDPETPSFSIDTQLEEPVDAILPEMKEKLKQLMERRDARKANDAE